MSDPLFPFAGVANPEPNLSRLVERARWLAALDLVLRQCLPATLANQTRLANIDERRLVFLVSSPVWKTKLRPLSHLIETAAENADLPGRTLVIKVAPELFATPALPILGKPLSTSARRSLSATAQSLSDPNLRDQLLALAAHT